MNRDKTKHKKDKPAAESESLPALPVETPRHPLPTALVIILVAAAFFGAIFYMTPSINPQHRESSDWVSGGILTATTGLMELGFVLAIALSAGGLGSLLVMPIAPKNLDRGLLSFTCVAAGFWMIATAVLVLGSMGLGFVFQQWFWYGVLGLGATIALVRARKQIASVKLPEKLPVGSLLWIFPAIAAGLWMTGALRPVFFTGYSGDGYDVALYHLQVPREWILAGRVSVLDHNVYSHYPMGLESLYMVAMTLRGGPWEAMYTAKMLHGLHGLLAAAAIWASLRRTCPVSARAGAVLVATVPYLIILSFSAMVELSQLFWLVMTLLWLGQWLAQANWRNSLLLGLCVGGSCTVKYLSVGLVAAPVAAVMIIASISKPRRFAATGLAVLAGLASFAPWMIRNIAATGNPVFPLATTMIGPGTFAPQDEQRWLAGHGREVKAPVPVPIPPFDDEPLTQTDRAGQLYETFFSAIRMNPLLAGATLIAAAAGLGLFVRSPSRHAFALALAAIAACQVGVWALFTHEMLARFITPAMATFALLVTFALAMPTARRSALAVNLFVLVIAAGGLWMTWIEAPQAQLNRGKYLPPSSTAEMANMVTPAAYQASDKVKPLLVGQGPAWYHPDGSMYATVFDSAQLLDWLGADLSPDKRLEHLHQLGVTHIEVNWIEVRRLAKSYGLPHALADGALAAETNGTEPTIELIEQLKPLGLSSVGGTKPGLSLYALPWAPKGTK